MYENLKKYNIILASGSPRRKSLLRDLGLNFEVRIIKNIDESFPDDLIPEKVAEFIAGKKAGAYKDLISEKDLVITADTVVCCKNKILGKPSGRKEAVEMIKSLSGSVHYVYTGVCLLSKDKKDSFTSMTKVSFTTLTDEQINYYIDTFKPYDKAGAYGIQEWIGLVGVKSISGSYHNVMGLPVCRLVSALEKF